VLILGMAEEEIITVYVNELLIQILAGLILAGIVGGITSIFVLYKCIHRQAQDIRLMKRANAFVLRRHVNETKMLHPEAIDELEDLEKTYNDLTKDDSK